MGGFRTFWLRIRQAYISDLEVLLISVNIYDKTRLDSVKGNKMIPSISLPFQTDLFKGSIYEANQLV